jgi:hypothetical protein
MSADLFKEILPSILQTKEPFCHTAEDERNYPAFMVNRALSFHGDVVLIANEMNKYPDIDKKLQIDFLLNIVRAQKRPFSRWHKKALNGDLEVIKEYYGYSDSKASEALKILTEEQITELREKLYKGD